MMGVLCDTNRSRGVIEVTALGDGAVRVDMTGLLEAYDRAARRWSRTRLVAAILGTLALSGSLALGAMALRWDVQYRRDVRVLKFFVQETETRVMCWRALALRWSRTPANTGVVDGHEAWVRGCVQRELSRQEDGAFGIRDRAPRKLEKVNHDEAVRKAYER
jgi:hypothetical protein